MTSDTLLAATVEKAVLAQWGLVICGLVENPQKVSCSSQSLGDSNAQRMKNIQLCHPSNLRKFSTKDILGQFPSFVETGEGIAQSEKHDRKLKNTIR